MPEAGPRRELETVAADLGELDGRDIADGDRRAALAALLRRVAFSELVGATGPSRHDARTLIHACVARLSALQANTPARRPGLVIGPGERWLVATRAWTGDELEAAIAAWRGAGARRAGLTLLVPCLDGRPGEEDEPGIGYPLGGDRSLRLVDAGRLFALDGPAVLVGPGEPGEQIERAIAAAVAA